MKFNLSYQDKQVDTIRRLILPSYYDNITREKLIDDFLRQNGHRISYKEMLNRFMTDVLLAAEKVGIEKLLLNQQQSVVSRRQNFSLSVIKPNKPKVSEVAFEEVGGDMTSDTKSILIMGTDVKQSVDVDKSTGIME